MCAVPTHAPQSGLFLRFDSMNILQSKCIQSYPEMAVVSAGFHSREAEATNDSLLTEK